MWAGNLYLGPFEITERIRESVIIFKLPVTKPSDISEISDVGGERHKILGVLEIPLTISGATFVFNFYVLPALQHSVIIGIDFMETYKLDDMSLAWPAVVQLLVFIYSGIQ